MYQDPIVEEVRIRREAYARQFNYSIDAIYQDMKEREAKSGHELVSLPPKRVAPPGKKHAENERNGGLRVGSD